MFVAAAAVGIFTFQHKALPISPLLLQTARRYQATCEARDPYLRSRSNAKVENEQEFVLLCGTANPELADKVRLRLGLAPQDKNAIKKFADGETSVSFERD